MTQLRKHCHVVTCVRVNAITTILQLALVTHGYLLRVQSIWLNHPYLLGVPIVGKDQYGYITPAFSGSP